MKKYILFALMLTFAIIAEATVINVDNKSNRPSGYVKSLQLAITNSSVGDTIYVYPSNQSYGAITITKELHIFGFGYDGTSGAVSKVDHIYLDTVASPSSTSSGTTIQGLTVVRLYCSKPYISDIVISGNSFTNYLDLGANCSGWLITNNYLSYISLNNNTSIVVSNNVFRSHPYGIYTSNSSSVVISNNLFMQWSRFSNVHNATVSNNIFICNANTYVGTDMTNNVFNNNITYCSNSSYSYTLPTSGNSGAGNLSNQNPVFVTGTVNSTYDYSKDYNLQSTSPGIDAGTDGSDIGEYGGNNPFVWGGAFTIPKVTQLNIVNPIINQGTNIDINVKAKKADL